MINDTDGRKAWICRPENPDMSFFSPWLITEERHNEHRPLAKDEQLVEGVFLTLTEIAEINARQAEVVREAHNEGVEAAIGVVKSELRRRDGQQLIVDAIRALKRGE